MAKSTKKENEFETGNEVIRPVPVDEQYMLDYGKYSYFVSIDRICPDYRDGLLNAQRSIVAAAKLDTGAENRRVKSAAIVGDVMKKYHPHGDQSIYGTMVNMANYFSCKYPLIQKKGNFGTIDGDSEASYRYTEAKLSSFCIDILTKELKQYSDDSSTDWIPNYSKSDVIPEYLPARAPLLLMNGIFTIGVGDCIQCPPHNACEVIDACLALLKNRNAKVILIPDFPLATEVVKTDWAKISKCGAGKYTVRGIAEVMPYCGNNKKYKDRNVVRITSLPPQVTVGSIIESVNKLITEKKLTQIETYESYGALDSETNELTVDLAFVLTEGADGEYVKNVLYKRTALQKSFSLNLQVKKDKQRVHVGYGEYLNMFLDYRRMSHLRTLYNVVSDLSTRNEKLQPFIDLIDSGKFDQIQTFVRAQKNETNLEQKVIDKFNINQIQARYALNSTTAKQAGFERTKMGKEVVDNEAKIQEALSIIRNPGMIDQVIASELLEIKKKYAHPRHTVVVDPTHLGPSGRFLCVVTENNKIKMQAITEPLSCSKNDSIRTVIDMDISSGVLVFTDNGRCYKIPGEKIPFSPVGSSGEDVRIINNKIGGNITFVTSEEIMNDAISRGDFLITLTKCGFIKRVSLDDFGNVALSGTTYVKVDGDKVVDVCLSRADMRIIVYDQQKALCLDMNDISWAKRNARGSSSMKSEVVEGMTAVLPNMTDLLVITSKGYINRISPISLKTGRAKAGSSVIKLKDGDSIFAILAVEPGHVLRTFCSNETIDIPVESIKIGSSVSTGVKMVKQTSGNIIKVQIL